MIGVNPIGQLGYFINNEWEWLTIEKSKELITESVKRIRAGKPLPDRRCDGCGSGIVEKQINRNMYRFRYACRCSGDEPIDDTWHPITRREELMVYA